MKILIIRHADPDYEADSLTEQGWKEAGLLAERISAMDIRKFYVSPLGRAKDTASLTLKKMQREAQECEWLREFSPMIERPDKEGKSITWDWLPKDWTAQEAFYHKQEWMEHTVMQGGKVAQEYVWVTASFDEILAQHGYEREGNYYRAVCSNMDTIAFFCHFGLECVLLSHLLGVSPMVLWHGTCAAPSSVTTLVTEERRQGIASFRMSSFGDVSHLIMAGEQPSFSARFCECFANEQERHD
ncbi:MAG: histidine phosphatase family protein [Eubacterium sp.]|nr:histidine phosphatase family protein [Eubacterium sp.]